MRVHQNLFSAIYFFVNLALFTAGLCLIYLDSSLDFRAKLSDFIFQPSIKFSLIGYAVVFLSVLLFVGFYNLTRQRYLMFQTQKGLVEIDKLVVHHFVREFWKNNVPQGNVLVDLRFTEKQKIEIVAKCEEFDLEKMRVPLDEIEKKLSRLFAKQFHYHQEFYVTFLTP